MRPKGLGPPSNEVLKLVEGREEVECGGKFRGCPTGPSLGRFVGRRRVHRSECQVGCVGSVQRRECAWIRLVGVPEGDFGTCTEGTREKRVSSGLYGTDVG